MQTFRLAAGAKITHNRPTDEAATQCLKKLHPSSVEGLPDSRELAEQLQKVGCAPLRGRDLCTEHGTSWSTPLCRLFAWRHAVASLKAVIPARPPLLRSRDLHIKYIKFW